MLAATQSIRPAIQPPSTAPPQPRRVLIVAPHFPPINAPDGMRARLMLPHLAALGWKADVLTVRPEFVEAPIDPDLAATVPVSTRVHRVLASSPHATRRWHWGSLARRAYAAMRARGDTLLARGQFDLVFFSTCQFGILPLGPYWRRRHGVPYVLDFQDEWAGDYYERHPGVRPPGGRLKYGVSHALARWQEGPVVQRAAQIVSVSARYNANLQKRHPHLDPAKLHVLPFGAAESDFQLLKQRRVNHGFFAPGHQTNWVYVGRGGPTMHLAARAFFLALQRAAKNRLAPADLHLHFIGTAYAPSDCTTTFEPIGSQLVPEVPLHEQTARVPHFTALQCLLDANAVLIFGSDDPGYSASKLAPCLFAAKPILGIFHENSANAHLLKETGGGLAVTFADGDSPSEIAGRIYESWFVQQHFQHPASVPAKTLAAVGARAMTSQLARIFAAACHHAKAAT